MPYVRTGDAAYCGIFREADGIAACDGWEPYAAYEIHLCRAHTLRESVDLAEKNSGSAAAGRLHGIFERTYGKACQKRRPGEQKAAYKRLVRCAMDVARRYGYPVLLKSAAGLRNTRADMFGFVLNPEIPHTNNAAGYILHDAVIHRKIRGGMRSHIMMEWMGDFHMRTRMETAESGPDQRDRRVCLKRDQTA